MFKHLCARMASIKYLINSYKFYRSTLKDLETHSVLILMFLSKTSWEFQDLIAAAHPGNCGKFRDDQMQDSSNFESFGMEPWSENLRDSWSYETSHDKAASNPLGKVPIQHSQRLSKHIQIMLPISRHLRPLAHRVQACPRRPLRS